jgi:phosphate transport system permease protein
MNSNKKERAIKSFFLIISSSALLILIGIFIFLFITGIQAFNEISINEFFLGRDWNPQAYSNPAWGILSLFVGTLMVTGGALIFAIPLGIASAVYISEIASPKIRETIKPAIEMIASVPSVVLGLIGILLLSPLIANIFGLSSGLNALTSSIIVGIMVLPTIISISEDVITSLPKEFKEASLALGATKWQTIRNIVLPNSLGGMSTGSILGVSRAMGETAPILMVGATFFISYLPTSVFDKFMALPYHLFILATQHSSPYAREYALGTSLVLIALIFMLNSGVFILRYKLRKKKEW